MNLTLKYCIVYTKLDRCVWTSNDLSWQCQRNIKFKLCKTIPPYYKAAFLILKWLTNHTFYYEFSNKPLSIKVFYNEQKKIKFCELRNWWIWNRLYIFRQNVQLIKYDKVNRALRKTYIVIESFVSDSPFSSNFLKFFLKSIKTVSKYFPKSNFYERCFKLKWLNSFSSINLLLFPCIPKNFEM